ncbi:MAG: hypothetical protein HQP61_07990 [Peptococcaceae bacterium]|nr:hypothetical protein [Candidatus Syntrophopropionicum ammoniitolerans]
MAKMLREGATYTQRDIIDILSEFSSFKDRVIKKFKDLSRELEGKANEHELWVNVYLISNDYAEEVSGKRLRLQEQMQKSTATTT